MTSISSVCSSIKEVNDNFNPLDIFQIVEMDGIESNLSICPSIVLLTPVIVATLSKVSPSFFRYFFRFSAIIS